MKKWGVWLISISFLVGAVLNYLDVILQKNPSYGFVGFHFQYNSGPSPSALVPQFDPMALVGLCVNLYIAYNLFKFRNDGRVWALVVLWLYALNFMVWFVLFCIKNHVSPFSMIDFSVSFSNYIFNCPLILLSGVPFLFYIIQVYFLMRKDVKAEFQKLANVDVSRDKSEGQPQV